MLHPNFVIIGAIIQFFGSYPYLRETLQGKVKPNKVSWFLWALAPLIAVAAQLQQAVGIHVLTTFIVGFVPLLIFLASFKNKNAGWKITRLDIICGILSLMGIVLWLVTAVGNIAIVLALFADFLAGVPTFVKSYKFPETENASVFFFGVINAVIGLLTISVWNFEYYAFPLYLLFANSLLVLLIHFKFGKKLKNVWSSK